MFLLPKIKVFYERRNHVVFYENNFYKKFSTSGLWHFYLFEICFFNINVNIWHSKNISMGKIYMCPLLIFLMKKSLLLKSKRNTSIVFFFLQRKHIFRKEHIWSYEIISSENSYKKLKLGVFFLINKFLISWEFFL